MIDKLKRHNVNDNTFYTGLIDSVRVVDNETVLRVVGVDGDLVTIKESALWRSKKHPKVDDIYIIDQDEVTGRTSSSVISAEFLATMVDESPTFIEPMKALVVFPVEGSVVDKINRIKTMAGLTILSEEIRTVEQAPWIRKLYCDTDGTEKPLDDGEKYYLNVVTGTEDAITASSRRCSNANYLLDIARLVRDISIMDQ